MREPTYRAPLTADWRRGASARELLFVPFCHAGAWLAYEDGDEDDGVDEVSADACAGACEGDDERTAGCLAAGGQEVRVVVGHRDGEEEDAADEYDDDAVEHRADCLGHVTRRVCGLSCRQPDHLRAAVLQGCEDEDFEDAFHAFRESSRVFVELEADLLAADGAAGD